MGAGRRKWDRLLPLLLTFAAAALGEIPGTRLPGDEEYFDDESQKESLHNAKSDWTKDYSMSDYSLDSIPYSIYPDYNRNYFLKKRSPSEYDFVNERWWNWQGRSPAEEEESVQNPYYYYSYPIYTQKRNAERIKRNAFLKAGRTVDKAASSERTNRLQLTSSDREEQRISDEREGLKNKMEPSSSGPVKGDEPKKVSKRSYSVLDSENTEKRATPKSKFDRYLGGMGLGKRVQPDDNRYDFLSEPLPLMRENIKWNRVSEKRATPRSKFDRYLGGMGLGKRNSLEEIKPGTFVTGNDAEFNKRAKPKSKFDRYLGGMGLGKRNDFEEEKENDSDEPLTQENDARWDQNTEKRGPKSKFDRYLGGIGLGKRSQLDPDGHEKSSRVIQKRSAPKSKFDRYLGGMGLGKRRSHPYNPQYEFFLKNGRYSTPRRHTYDPMWNKMGIGKRNAENDGGLEKRQRPKYDPGWKFIGLGKRDRTEVRKARISNPYLGILALSNLTDFFTSLKKELRSDRDAQTNSVHANGIESKSLPKLGSMVYVRDRKPSVKFGSQPKSIYDPAWRLTGLGR